MTAVSELKVHTTELKKVAEKFAGEAKVLDRDGRLRIRKLEWLFEKKQIRQQRVALRRARSPLVEAF